MYYEFDHTTAENGAVVNQITYEPNGTDHRLQQRITELLDRLVQADGKVTLAELGYLHSNTLLYDRQTGRVQLKVYFDVHYAARVVGSKVNSARSLVPVKELEIFQNYLFVGPVAQAVTYETIMAPKSKMIQDEMNRPSISFKDDAKLVETDVLVLNCNLMITMAALHDLSLEDPQFAVRCDTVGKGDHNKEKRILRSGNSKVSPVKVTVTCGQLVDGDGDPIGYDPDTCMTYLRNLQEKKRRLAENKEELAEKARAKAEKKAKTSNNRNFNKYS